ncbi:hypothetical protein KAR91_55540 [Candidatus Pacearchaeota archaeon]|nr:hypothetical protein [Candidatus Pacearchaeota archaeon]
MSNSDTLPTRNLYKTSDLNIAAYLKAKFKFDIVNTECDENTRRVFFIFDISDKDIDSIITEYVNGKDKCSVNLFTRELAGLRTMIRNRLENPKI